MQIEAKVKERKVALRKRWEESKAALRKQEFKKFPPPQPKVRMPPPLPFRLVQDDQGVLTVDLPESILVSTQRKAADEARLKAEKEAQIKANKGARVKAEDDAQIKAEEESRIIAEEEARIKVEDDARLKAEEEAKINAEEEYRIKAEKGAQINAEKEARIKAEREAKIIAEEQARFKAEEEAKIRVLSSINYFKTAVLLSVSIPSLWITAGAAKLSISFSGNSTLWSAV